MKTFLYFGDWSVTSKHFFTNPKYNKNTFLTCNY